MFSTPVLYCISDPANGDPVELFGIVVTLGIEFFQFRHKHLSSVQRAAIASRLAQQPRQSTRLLINGLDPATEKLNADGIHLPAAETMHHARAATHAKIVGASAHSLQEAVEFSEAGIDYILLAPIFPALSKPDSRSPLGLTVLSQACRCSKAPVLALGGIMPERFQEVLDAGAAGVAGISLFADPSRLGEIVSAFRETVRRK